MESSGFEATFFYPSIAKLSFRKDTYATWQRILINIYGYETVGQNYASVGITTRQVADIGIL